MKNYTNVRNLIMEEVTVALYDIYRAYMVRAYIAFLWNSIFAAQNRFRIFQ